MKFAVTRFIALASLLISASTYAANPIEGRWLRSRAEAGSPFESYALEYLAIDSVNFDVLPMLGMHFTKTKFMWKEEGPNLLTLTSEAGKSQRASYKVESKAEGDKLSICSLSGCHVYERVSTLPEFRQGAHGQPGLYVVVDGTIGDRIVGGEVSQREMYEMLPKDYGNLTPGRAVVYLGRDGDSMYMAVIEVAFAGPGEVDPSSYVASIQILRLSADNSQNQVLAATPAKPIRLGEKVRLEAKTAQGKPIQITAQFD